MEATSVYLGFLYLSEMWRFGDFTQTKLFIIFFRLFTKNKLQMIAMVKMKGKKGESERDKGQSNKDSECVK